MRNDMNDQQNKLTPEQVRLNDQKDTTPQKTLREIANEENVRISAENNAVSEAIKNLSV